ncbi:hypothetical protein OBBRIDRAFT_605447 [Obba rivulosa]|uniref:Uncharacterized protein n=1 Tax=Obba rivulosa TaxID=1052685 RepID=A0A8E2DJF0_9APHY|nr:hypothetical protein OBBRIDRAFT_605447 [Obba rivulosa]
MQLIDCRLQIMACFMQPREVSLLVAMRIGLDRQIALCIESPPRTAISLQSMQPAWPASRPPSPPPPGNEARQPAQPASRTSRGSSSPSARMKPAQR